MELAESDLLFIDVDASTPVKQEQEEAPNSNNVYTRRMPSDTQVTYLVECMEKYPELARGYIRSSVGRARSRRQWARVRARLNALPGARKDCSQWMKYWTDKKTFVKRKAAEGEIELNSIEEKILYLCAGAEATNVKSTEDIADTSLAHSSEDGSNTPSMATLNAAPSHSRTTDFENRTESQSTFDRILKIEERRLSMEQANAQLMRTILQQSVEKERTILSAVRSLNERMSDRNDLDREMAGALKVLGEGLIALTRAKRNLRFKCSTCAYVTYHRSLFREHRNRHDGIKPYKCDFCPYSSVSKKYAKQHQARHRSCRCGHVARNLKQLRQHHATCGETQQHHATCGETRPDVARYACARCQREYVDEKALAKHCSRAVCGGSLRSHQARDHRHARGAAITRTRFECGVCGWVGGNARGVLLHLIHHPPPPGPAPLSPRLP